MINIKTKILETLGKMPESLQEELLHYAEYLQEKYNENNGNINTSNRRSGILEGTFVLPLPDDFDEPLEDFEEYMKSNMTQLNDSDLVNDFRISWHEAMTGQTIPVSQLWKGLEDE